MSFDRVARSYYFLETATFGKTLQRARTFGLKRITPPKRALIVGEGNGRFLAELLNLYPEVEIDCLDASVRMLELARDRVRRATGGLPRGMRFLHQDVLAWKASGTYDLVVTHFVLDCFPGNLIKLIVEKLATVSQPGTTWLLADFAIPPAGWGRRQARIWTRAMYVFFRLTAGIPATELIDSSPYLESAGFGRSESAFWRNGMVKSEIWTRP